MLTFYETLFNHLGVFLALVLCVGAGLYLLARRHIFSFFDPLFYFLVVNETFCIADVLFMHQYGLIETRYLVNYLLTEGALLAGILQFSPRLPQATRSASGSPSATLSAFFKLGFPAFLLINLVVYALRGIPLFLESRTVVFAIGGGFGLLRRVSDVLLIVIIYYLLDLLRYRRWRLIEWGALTSLLMVQVLSGAKVAVLNLVFMIALFNYYKGSLKSAGALRADRLIKRLTIAAIAALLLVSQVQSGDQSISGRQVNVLGQVAARLVMNGDAFIYAYPDQGIESFPSRNPLGAMFREYLTFLRVAPPEALPKHLGSQITSHFLNEQSTFQTNEKHNLVGYLYFGFWGSLLYSYLLGTLIGAIRHFLPNNFPRTWIFGVPFIALVLGSTLAMNEPDALHQTIINLLFIYLPMVLVILLLKSNRLPRRESTTHI